MPKVTQDGTLADWGGLLLGVEEAGPDLAGIEPLREELRKVHAQAVVLKALRESLNTASEVATRQFNESLDEGRDAARRMRNFIRAALGPRSEALRCYGIKPLRRKPLRKAG